MPYVVGHKGQIVISKDIRDRLGVKSGWIALQRLIGGHIEVYFIPPEHKESLKASLSTHLKFRISPGKQWDKARKSAWDKVAKEKIIKEKVPYE